MEIWAAMSSLNVWTVVLAMWIPLAGWTLAVLWEDEPES